jgi:DNA-binding MarR family transcriptional regulator
VLGQLVGDGWVVQSKGIRDRRQRLLELTAKGVALERQLTERQRQKVARAYREAGPVAVEGFRQVMIGLIDEGDRRRFQGGSDRAGRRPDKTGSVR